MIVAGALVASRFLHFASLAVLVGSYWSPVYADLSGVKIRLRSFQRLAAIVGVISGVTWFVLSVATMAGDPAAALDPAILASTAHDTEFGVIWSVRCLGSLVLAGLVLARPFARGLVLEGLIAGALLASVALTGHAQADSGVYRVVHGVADALHLLAAGVWLGGLSVLLALLAAARDPSRLAAARQALERFSPTGMVVVAVIMATGVVNGFFLVGSPAALLTTDYGRLLSLKVGLFALMVGLAFLNRREAKAGPSRRAPTIRRVALEQALGAGVLIAVSVLGTLAPATPA